MKIPMSLFFAPGRTARLSPPPLSRPARGRQRAVCSAAAALLAGASWAPPAHGQGYPVIDIANVIQSTLQAERALEQIDQLSRQYAKQIEELSVAIQQRDALLGSRGLGRLLNGPQARSARRGLPSTFEELLRTLASAGGPRSFEELRALYEARSRELDLARPEDVNPGRPEGRTARVYARERTATLARLAVSEKAFADASRRVESYEQLMEAIDASPDLKASTDLANRILAENGLTMNELLRLQALALASATAGRAHELVDTSNVAEIAVYESVPLEELSRLVSTPRPKTSLENNR
jgi:type IV secretion system protein VirB5